MAKNVSLQIRLWPWSTAGDEIISVSSRDDLVEFPYFGSPLLAVSDEVNIFLPARNERFMPHGPSFKTLNGIFQLYEAPHGISTQQTDKSIKPLNLVVSDQNNLASLIIKTAYAKEEDYIGDIEEDMSSLSAIVRSWSTFFDECIDNSDFKDYGPKIYWKKIMPYLKMLKKTELQEPRMALIVHLANEMSASLTNIVHTARKVLLRERNLTPVGRVAELDAVCLNWYIRQPGETVAQKATVNRQRLMGVIRCESFDTLENRVLLDYIRRCYIEAHRYQQMEVGEKYKTSQRAKLVRRYHNICLELSNNAIFQNVSNLSNRIRPNTVLQNDARYRRVWRNYQRLLRQEDEEDRSWDWQARTWADLVRLLVNAALCDMPEDFMRPLMDSSLTILKEQKLGQRLLPGTEPGPFVITLSNKPLWVLEVVHPDEACKHEITKTMGRLGGHLYLVLNRIENKGSIKQDCRLLVVWAVHCASSTYNFDLKELNISASSAIISHSHVLSDHSSSCPKLFGLVVASNHGLDYDCNNISGTVLALSFPTDYRCWIEVLKEHNSLLQNHIRALIQ